MENENGKESLWKLKRFMRSLKLDPVNRQAQKGNLFPQSKEYVANLIFELRKPLIRESLDVMLTSMGDGLI